MPGANRATVSSLQDLVSASGGKLVGRYRVGDKLGDDSNKGLVDQLGTQLEPEADDVEMPDDVSTYQRFGLLLGPRDRHQVQGSTALRHHELQPGLGLRHRRAGLGRGHADGPGTGGAGRHRLR